MPSKFIFNYIYFKLLASFKPLLFTELYIKYDIIGTPNNKNNNNSTNNILKPSI